MQIERTEKEVIIRLDISLTDADVKQLLDYAKKLASSAESKKTQVAVEKIKEEEIAAVLKTSFAKHKRTLSFTDFSFAKSRKALENYKGSLSAAVIEERRSEL